MPSLEALAMSGADYKKCGVSLMEKDRRETPQYLLADEKPTGGSGIEVKLSAPPAQLWAKVSNKGKKPFVSTMKQKAK
ncbi:hypothetical protein LINPERPRIM_LOCUS40545 [Linum perenne]